MSEKIAMHRHNYDVVVIGAGGAGLRAAVEARSAGLRVAIICKSLFGKAHTVMAEGGIAASMGNVNEKDGYTFREDASVAEADLNDSASLPVSEH